MATGEYLIIQDADLEYDPTDYMPMLRALLSGRADVVYGSRYLGRGRHSNQSLGAYLGGRSLSVIALVFTGRYLTDTVTALKLFHRDRLAAIELETSGFELDHEITREAGTAGSANRRSADSLHAAEPRGGKEDRAARLVHRRPHVHAISEWMRALTVVGF